jgi:hypothetical protein
MKLGQKYKKKTKEEEPLIVYIITLITEDVHWRDAG